MIEKPLQVGDRILAPIVSVPSYWIVQSIDGDVAELQAEAAPYVTTRILTKAVMRNFTLAPRRFEGASLDVAPVNREALDG